MNKEEIMEFLPHRPPMLLVHKIEELKENEKIVGSNELKGDEWFFQGHFPQEPVMPGVMIVEAMAQTGAVLILKSKEEFRGKVIYFMGIDNVKFRKPVRPGDKLMLEVVPEKIKAGAKGAIAKIKGQALVNGEKVAEADMTAMITNK